MSTTVGLIQVNTLADLKNQPMAPDTMVLCPGIATKLDNMGGLYMWDAESSAAEDNTNYNVVLSNLSATGRWLRVFQRVLQLPHGRLTYTGSTKIFHASGVTDANGQCTLNLTLDNTPTGPSIFTSISFNDSQFTGNAATPTDAVLSRVITQPSGSLKTTTHGFYKANLLSIVLNGPFAAVGAGVAVRFRVEGQ